MTRFLTTAALALTLAGPALATDCTTSAALPTPQIPQEIADQIAILQAEGHRFLLVIDLIRAEAARPDWTWAEPCSEADAHALLARGE